MGGRDISGEAPCGGTKAYRTLREEEEEEGGVGGQEEGLVANG